MGPVRVLLLLVRGVFLDRAELAAENLALRQQLAALQLSPNVHACGSVIGSSGRFYPGSSRIGVPPFSSYSQTL